MTIKQQGGIFGRNPTFNDVTIDGTLTTSGSQTMDALNVEGTVTSDGLTVEGTTTLTGDFNVEGDADYGVEFRGTVNTVDSIKLQSRFRDDTNAAYYGGSHIEFIRDGNWQSSMTFDTAPDYSGRNGISRMRIDDSGDIIFYDDAGSSQDLTWDASTSRLGIGDTSPDNELAVNGAISLANGSYQTAGLKNWHSNSLANGATETISIDLGNGNRFFGLLIVSMTRNTSANYNTSRVYAYNLRGTSGTITQLFTANGSDGSGSFSVAAGSSGGEIDITNNSGATAHFSALIVHGQNI